MRKKSKVSFEKFMLLVATTDRDIPPISNGSGDDSRIDETEDIEDMSERDSIEGENEAM